MKQTLKTRLEQTRNESAQFIRKALGSFKKESIKTLDEMGELLCELGIVSSIAEGKIMAPSLDDTRAVYGDTFLMKYKILCIDKIGQESYRISTCKEDI